MAPSELGGLSTFAFATSSTNPLGWTTYTQYDYYLGEEVDEQDANGVVDSSFYDDPLDRETKQIEANNITNFRRQTRMIYDDANHRIEVRADSFTFGDELQKSESYYDGLGRTTESRKYEADGTYTAEKTEYDAIDRPYKESNPFRPSEITPDNPVRWTTTKFDALGRVIELDNPDGSSILTSYTGNFTTVTDEGGKGKRNLTNALGLLIRVDEPGTSGDFGTVGNPNQSTNYAYDCIGNLTQITQGVQTRTFVYNALSRLIQATNPESGTFQYTYDNNGNLLVKTDALSTTTTHSYDALNRVTLRDYSSSTPDVSYTYDNDQVSFSKGNLTKVSSSVSETLYSLFDAHGRVLSSQQKIDGQEYTFGYTYNLNDDIKTQTYPSGKVVEFDYDSTGDLRKVTGHTGGADTLYANSFTYASHGEVEKVRLGNGRWETTEFNARRQITQVSLGYSETDAGLWKTTYEYGDWQSTILDPQKNNGSLARQTITVPTIGQVAGFIAIQTYSYDKLDRLKSATETIGGNQSWKQTFVYDRYGNRNFDPANTTLMSTESSAVKVANPEVLPSNNRYKSDQDNDSQDDYLYDASGNLTRNANAKNYTYDAENRQVTSTGSNLSMSYSYDGNGKRVKSYNAVTDQTTIFVYDADGDLAAEYTINIPQPQVPVIGYLTEDALGSPRIITNSYGPVKSRRDFLPFGEELHAGLGSRNTNQKYSASDDNTAQKFTGYRRDSETGLDFAQSRYYSPMHGRFTSPDEFKGGPDELFDFEEDASANPTFYADLTNPQSLNKYQYTYNNPYKYTDPNGHCPPLLVAAVAACVYILISPDTVNAPGPGDPVYRNERGNNVFVNMLTGGRGFSFFGRTAVKSQAARQATRQAVSQPAKQAVKQTAKQAPKGARNTKVADAIKKGKEAHKSFGEKVKNKPGWKSEPSLKDPKSGNTVRPDAVSRRGKPVELKPRTESGIKKGQQQLKGQERATGKKGRVVYYDPNQ